MSPEAVQSLSQFPPDWPEVEYLVSDNFVGSQRNLLRPDLPALKLLTNNYAAILAAPVSPLSRGNVTIASADTSDLPIVSPNWLTHPTDREVAVQGYKRAREFFNASSIAPVIVMPEVYPGPKVETDEEILSTIMDSFNTVWHASCTCKSLHLAFL